MAGWSTEGKILIGQKANQGPMPQSGAGGLEPGQNSHRRLGQGAMRGPSSRARAGAVASDDPITSHRLIVLLP